MTQATYRLFLVLAALTLLLAACTPTTSTGTLDSGATPGADDMTTTQAVPETGGVTGECAGVDTQQLVTTGEVYYAENCASCHGAQGEGQGDFPALVGNENLAAGNVTQLVTNYFSVPAHPQDVSAEELSAVLTYAGSTFASLTDPVCPDQIMLPAGQ